MEHPLIQLFAAMSLCALAGVCGAQFWFTGLTEQRTSWLSVAVMAGVVALAYFIYG